MNVIELFNTYGGKRVRYHGYWSRHASNEWQGYVRIIGYNAQHGELIYELPEGFPSEGDTIMTHHVLLPSINRDSVKANIIDPANLDYTDILKEASDKVCCRCGNLYSSRKEHRPQCKRESK